MIKKLFGVLDSPQVDDDAIKKKKKDPQVPTQPEQVHKEAVLHDVATTGLIDVNTMTTSKPVVSTEKDRYSSFISTDKPIYKKGDTVYCRAVVLNSLTNKPLDDTYKNYLQYGATVKVLSPGGDEVVSVKAAKPQDSVFSFCWNVSQDAAGGHYTCKIEFEQKGFPSAQRKFEVRAFQNPRLNSDLTFLKKGYGAGEEAVASLKVSRAEGGKPSGAKITATSRIDGKETWKGNLKLDDDGNCLVKFKLPDSIEVGDGTLSCVIEDGGVLETASKTIPILLQSLDVKVYPEGGDLIEDVECGVYIEAFTPYGDPADLEGDIIDQNGNIAGKIQTKHEGRGKGKFTPKKGNSYSLKINSPSGIKNEIPFPNLISDGVSLMAKKDVYDSSNIDFTVSGKKGEYIAYLYKRDILCQSKKFKIDKAPADLTLSTNDEYNGVLRVLITNAKHKPMAERLVFQSPKETIDLKITTDYKSYAPGDKATVKISATTKDGKPVTTIVGVTATDESVLKSVEERKRAPRLQQMVFLESEVDHFEDAQIYLSDHNDAVMAVDLLLGTQGWRRFAFYDVQKFLELKGEIAERIVAYHDGRTALEIYNENTIVLDQFFEEEDGGERGMMKFDFMDQVNFCAPAEALFEPQLQMMQPQVNRMAPQSEMEILKPVQKEIKAVNNIEIKPVRKKEVQQKQAKQKEFKPVNKKQIQMDFEIDAKMLIQKEEMEIMEDQDDEYYSGGESEQLDDSVVVRVYSFSKNPKRKIGERSTFVETLYWNASMLVKGENSFSFDMSDSVTSYRVMLDAFTNDGIFGSQDKLIECKEPFYIEAKLPVEVTVGDVLQIPVAIVNESPEDLKVQLDHHTSIALLPPKDSKFKDSFNVSSKERTKKYLELKVDQPHTRANFGISASAGVFSDKVTRKLDLVPTGFPFEIAFSGQLETDDEEVIFNIPKEYDPESVDANLKLYLKPVGQLQNALKSLLQRPSGCFEQTSSTTYPTIIAHQYFVSHDGIDPDLIKRSYDLLDEGYKRLTSYECKGGGYEWFGYDPANEALTAYGTLEFIDMSKVYPVDVNMLNRTKSWLYSRRDGKGGFKLDSQALDDFGAAPKDITNAYIVWSLLEAGETGLDLELDAIYKDAISKKDAYLWGLAAASLFTAKRTKEANELAKKIVENQEKSGEVNQAKTTITCSRGISKNIETTAIAILTWINDSKYVTNVESAMSWLMKQCNNGRFGNTQSTILALKAIVKYDSLRGADTSDLEVNYALDGEEHPVDFGKKNDEGFVEIPLNKKALTPGDHKISLKMKGKGKLPYSFFLQYYSIKPASSDKCEIDLKNYLSSDKFEEGSTGEMNVEITNLSKEKQAMTLAIISIPGGLEPRHENLQELVKGKKIAFYEIKGRDVVIYLRGMKEQQKLNFKFDVVARIPGKFKSSASRAYLYYVDEDVKWVDGTECTITPKQ